MRSGKQILIFIIATFLWFLALPFPFKNGGWAWSGGYRIVKAIFPFSGDFAQHEIDITNAYYTSRLYPLLLFIVAAILGYLTLMLYFKLSTGKSSKYVH